MKIALVHHAVIPPRKYGGTERLIYWLMNALEDLGHQIVLVSRPGGAESEADDFIEFSENWEDALPRDVDLVHLWAPPGKEPKKPCLVTIGGNGKPGEVFHRNSVFVSLKHAQNHGGQHFVHNGIDIDAYPCDPERNENLVFLAKASWSVKNLPGALEIARAAGLPLEVLGSRDLPWDIHRHLPRIRGVKYHGMVDDDEKRAILRRAKALLFPVRWHEPFGLAITEALASGCAVLGTPYGSLPEIVTPECGLLSRSAQEHVRYLGEKWNPSPNVCRGRVSQGFSHLDMGRSYESLYRRILTEGSLGDVQPRTQQSSEGLSSSSLLPWLGL